MTTRRVMIAASTRAHLSVRGDLQPLCNQHGTDWDWFAVTKSPTAGLCENCWRIVDRLYELAIATIEGGQPNG